MNCPHRSAVTSQRRTGSRRSSWSGSGFSGGERLLHISDMVLYPPHLEHPEWISVFDLPPKPAAKSKRRLFDLAAAGNTLVFAYYFPSFPNLGHIVKEGTGWLKRPIEESRETA